MIEVKNLTKKYREFCAVDDISFNVERGEVLGFLGPNGAGKTTTMKMLTGFMPPTNGEMKLAGFDVLENPIEVKKRIGYLPEIPPLYPEMRVGDVNCDGSVNVPDVVYLMNYIFDYGPEPCANPGYVP